MTATATIDRVEFDGVSDLSFSEQLEAESATQLLMTSSGMPGMLLGIDTRGRYSASTYWPNGDICRDKHCCGHGATLGKAIEALRAKVEKAKLEVKTLKTAAECKAAVIDLIREHDAAPASFRDAVDALPVAS